MLEMVTYCNKFKNICSFSRCVYYLDLKQDTFNEICYFVSNGCGNDETIKIDRKRQLIFFFFSILITFIINENSRNTIIKYYFLILGSVK